MIALFFIFFVLTIVNSRSIQRPETFFRQWMVKHNKQYSEEEYKVRLTTFFDNARRIDQLNARSKELNSTATFAINKFADLTAAEFSQRLGMKGFKSGLTDDTPVAISYNKPPPNAWDWRNHGGITGQKDEGQCGSCWAMTVAMAIESAYMIHKQVRNQPQLSTQQIIDCDTNDQGCNGGMPTSAYQYVVSAGGLESDANYPYKAMDGTCNVTKGLIIDPITGYELVIPTGSTNELAMASFLAYSQPISTAVDASSWQFYNGGIFMASQCTQNIDHGVQIIGYNGLTSKGYWTIRNMWGSSWGEQGFIRLQFGENTCGLTSLPTAPTLS